MPFCTNCGTRVNDTAAFCWNCGTKQPQSAAQYTDFFDSFSNRTASILCYVPVFGVIPAIVFLASHKFRRNAWVRFDAFQSLYLFVAWLILSSALPTLFSGLPGFGAEHALFGLIKLAILICWIYLIVKAAQNQQVRLPILGDLASRSAFEQL
ncbi:MAG TPA: zinc-ribbon domain-containing protein [Bryobacteraceae bacterium]|nr:zinc-ribbon domain-containing protein [Bryobacteraceae bacterium]